ncbi:TPA: hypothetical protein N0F65_003118 [Lagenidium giganteum]|uniref:Peptidase S1 domain-containing protein n=1 Tax=Lagenidium giganteum TaxID=4803 RepID=A0AAV2YTX2_9STRA|nr:TPA: hypothetical protein N0F65_003118 [Lagenidium giganteum]
MAMNMSFVAVGGGVDVLHPVAEKDDNKTSTTLLGPKFDDFAMPEDEAFPGGWHRSQLPKHWPWSTSTVLLLPSLPAESSDLSLIGCMGFSIAPLSLLASRDCLSVTPTPRVYVSTQNSDGEWELQSYDIDGVHYSGDVRSTLAIAQLQDPIPHLQPFTLSERTLPFQHNEKRMKLVPYDHIFSKTAREQRAFSQVVRLPFFQCGLSTDSEAIQCLAPGEPARRHPSISFGRGLVLDDDKLFALPVIGDSAFTTAFHAVEVVGARKRWINVATDDTVTWAALPDVVALEASTKPILAPGYVSIFADGNKNVPVCGGVLISPRYALASAKCLENRWINFARVGAGRRDLPHSRGREEVHRVRRVSKMLSASDDGVAVIQLEGLSIFSPVILDDTSQYQVFVNPNVIVNSTAVAVVGNDHGNSTYDKTQRGRTCLARHRWTAVCSQAPHCDQQPHR